ncbi:MAG: hypothetical protein LC650_02110 [Actinobacteria bacterium]|nr:hypothetical protein [Actinomycetota bacterium]
MEQDGRCFTLRLAPHAITLRVASDNMLKRTSADLIELLTAALHSGSPSNKFVLRAASDTSCTSVFPTELSNPFPECETALIMSKIVAETFPWGREFCSASALKDQGLCFVDFCSNTPQGDHLPNKIRRSEALVAELEHAGIQTGSQWTLPKSHKSLTSGYTLTDFAAKYRIPQPAVSLDDDEMDRLSNTMALAVRPPEQTPAASLGLRSSVRETSRVDIGALTLEDFGLSRSVLQRTAVVFCFRSDRTGLSLLIERNGGHHMIVTIERAHGIMYGKPPSRVATCRQEPLCDLYRAAIQMAASDRIPLEVILCGSRLAISRALVADAFFRGQPPVLPPPRYPPARHGKRSASSQTYSGGYVFEATPGLFAEARQEVVVMADFDSHYPSIMCEENDALPAQLLPDQPSCSVAVPALQRAIATLIERKRSPRSLPSRVASKLEANALYGSFGSSFSPLYSIRIASAITRHGRDRLVQLQTFVSGRFSPKAICFGHTDSIAYVATREADHVALAECYTREYLLGGQARVGIDHVFDRMWCLSRTSYAGLKRGATDRFECTSKVRLDPSAVYLPHWDLSAPMNKLTQSTRIKLSLLQARYLAAELFKNADKSISAPGVRNSLYPPLFNFYSLVFLRKFLAHDNEEDIDAAKQFFADAAAHPEDHLLGFLDSSPWTRFFLWTTNVEYKPDGAALGRRNDNNYRKFLSAQMKDTLRAQPGLDQKPDRYMRVYRDANVGEHCLVVLPGDGDGDDECISPPPIDYAYWWGRFYDHWSTLVVKTLHGTQRARALAILEPLAKVHSRHRRAVARAFPALKMGGAGLPDAGRLAQILDSLPPIPKVIPNADAIAQAIFDKGDSGEAKDAAYCTGDDLSALEREVSDYVEQLAVAARGQREVLPVLYDALLRHVDITDALRRHATSGSAFVDVNLGIPPLSHHVVLYQKTACAVALAYGRLA